MAIDPITNSLLLAAAKPAAGSIYKFLQLLGKEAYTKVASELSASFGGHIDTVRDKCSKLKNIIYTDEYVDFRSQYVNTMFSSNENDYNDLEIFNQICDGKKVLVSGTAGAGKTMFIRWCALEFIDKLSDLGRIPIYIEMRDLTEDDANLNFENLLSSMTSPANWRTPIEVFKKGLESGHLVLLLDAIDEIKPKIREKVLKNIKKFLRDYPDCGVIVTTRPDQTVESISDLTVYHSKPLRKDQIELIIKNIKYEDKIKFELLTKLDTGLYDRLKGFLTTPLLATILLLTFGHTADVPTKVTTFYKHAFEVLYQRHDAYKGVYKREHHSSLSIDQFKSTFSAFCFSSYLVSKYEFSDEELVSQMRAALEYVLLEEQPEKVVRDSMESVCLVVRDGLRNIFAHRSFQEYFAAAFVQEYWGDDIFSLIEGLYEVEETNMSSGVLEMLHEISADQLEFRWMLPVLESLENELARFNLDTLDGFTDAFNFYFNGVIIQFSDFSVRGGALTGNTWRLWKISNILGGKFDIVPIFGNNGSLGEKDIVSESLPAPVRKIFDIRMAEADKKNANNGMEIPNTIGSKAPDLKWLYFTKMREYFKGSKAGISMLLAEIKARKRAKSTMAFGISKNFKKNNRKLG